MNFESQKILYAIMAFIMGLLALVAKTALLTFACSLAFFVFLFLCATTGRPDSKMTPPGELLKFDIGMTD